MVKGFELNYISFQNLCQQKQVESSHPYNFYGSNSNLHYSTISHYETVCTRHHVTSSHLEFSYKDMHSNEITPSFDKAKAFIREPNSGCNRMQLSQETYM